MEYHGNMPRKEAKKRALAIFINNLGMRTNYKQSLVTFWSLMKMSDLYVATMISSYETQDT